MILAFDRDVMFQAMARALASVECGQVGEDVWEDLPTDNQAHLLERAHELLDHLCMRYDEIAKDHGYKYIHEMININLPPPKEPR